MKQTLGELEQTVLLAILRLGEDAYGVSIRREIAACTHREVAPGALYTTLDRLERKGVLEARSGDPTPERGGRSKRFYRLTRDGRTLLVEAQRGFRRLLDGLELDGLELDGLELDGLELDGLERNGRFARGGLSA